MPNASNISRHSIESPEGITERRTYPDQPVDECNLYNEYPSFKGKKNCTVCWTFGETEGSGILIKGIFYFKKRILVTVFWLLLVKEITKKN